MKLELHFGALVPTIAQQLSDAGIVTTKPQDIHHWQKDADAISRLNVRGLLTDSAAHAARRKLMKQIVKGCENHAKAGGKRRGK